ncbi:DesA family fatty acid desaturase [Vogesella indigofera]|uniref:DesA family fatty acid desaturase n=1 Tax=Vogesella indigofera TaxID=45465 RepID=UPI00234DB322|nr:fatty acid desaturase [Vogesella indigofera]MDC7704217.1 fatty acid desaturase [Vogesella indigofera]
MQLGLLDLPWWGTLLVTLGLTHVTIAAVTIFLHRHQAHHALALHPVVSHLFRFWLWLTTGMVTREWVAIHRKHHAACESADDPHSPQVYGLRTVLLQGAELYRRAATDPAMLEKYGHHTPDDWIERRLYARYSALGVSLMLVIDLLLFGPLGLSVWAVQMLWIPLFAAGVINGVGHYWGYRNFAPDDCSRNVVPWGILIGGEELHNNHHAYATSARLSSRRWEFDIGWLYIRLLAALRLATVHKLAPPLRYNRAKTACDAGTLQAVIVHRHHVLARFAHLLHPVAVAELGSGALQPPPLPHAAVRQWLQRGSRALPLPQRTALEQALRHNRKLNTIELMRQDLTALWRRSGTSKEQLVAQLEDWCRRAEGSGIDALREFSRALQSYDLPLGETK